MNKVAHLLRSLLLAAAVVSATASSAAPPEHTTQVPGFYRHKLGNFTVTALYDGYVDLDTALLKGLSTQDIQKLVARMFMARDKGVQTAVNAYLVHTGQHLLLIDAGAGQCFGPTLGQLRENLGAAGYAPEDVDAVLLTHLHPDHLCGLSGADGKRVFPKATVWSHGLDAEYWLSKEAEAAAPPSMKPFFGMARTAVSSYRDAGALRAFRSGEEIVPGVSALASHGHTPGHSSFLLSAGDQRLLVWGDIVHNHAVQFPRPEVSIEFDVDRKAAVDARKSLFERAARQGWWVAGAHLPFPGIGHVRQDGKAYAWVPVEFGPIRRDR